MITTNNYSGGTVRLEVATNTRNEDYVYNDRITINVPSVKEWKDEVFAEKYAAELEMFLVNRVDLNKQLNGYIPDPTELLDVEIFGMVLDSVQKSIQPCLLFKNFDLYDCMYSEEKRAIVDVQTGNIVMDNREYNEIAAILSFIFNRKRKHISKIATSNCSEERLEYIASVIKERIKASLNVIKGDDNKDATKEVAEEAKDVDIKEEETK